MNDPKTIKDARLIVTRLRMDTAVMTFHSERGTLTVGGKLQFRNTLEGRTADLNFELLHEMHRQLSRLDGVKLVTYITDNWTRNSDGHWSKKSAKIK
ncbi:MAG: hypothetical protein WCS70_14640 [Verrucomicrobiota bacterium]